MNRFLTLEELKKYRPKRDTYFVFGSPIGHTLSPKLHELYFSFHQLCGDYIAVKVEKEELKTAIDCVKSYARGVNLTIPLKEAVLPLLDETDPQAKKIGAVNTLLFEDGKIKGYNTDVYGVTQALGTKKIKLDGKNVLILGNGGACKSFLAAAEAASQITVAGRDLHKAQQFCAKTKAKAVRLTEISGKYDIVLNGTPVGMGELMSSSPLQPFQLQNCGFVFDCIYNPFSTNLLTMAEAYKIPCLNGLYMLIFQGLLAQSIWGNPVSEQDAAQIFDILQKEFTNQCKNIVLIGYMGSGKSTVGKEIAQKTGRLFLDMDQLLEEIEKKSVAEIFNQNGETYFRKQETRLAKILSKLNGAVIATGGGIIKNPENIEFFKKNAVVYLLDIPIEEIKKRLLYDTKRPLIKDPKQIEKLYHQRLESYRSLADIVITKTASTESAGEILEQFS